MALFGLVCRSMDELHRMADYTVTFLGPDGSLVGQETVTCDCDDDVIDLVGESSHPHAIDIHHGDRHVVRFPPWPRGF